MSCYPIKMYIRASTLSVVRVGRKFSKFSTLIAIIIVSLSFLFLVTLISSSDNKIPGGENDIFYRQVKKNTSEIKESTHEIRTFQNMFSMWRKRLGYTPKSVAPKKTINQRTMELPTWSFNKSVLIDDYLDLNDPHSYIIKPSGSRDSNSIIEMDSPVEKSSFCEPNVQILIMVASAPANFLARNAIRQTWGSKKVLESKGGRLIFVLGRSENFTIEDQVTEEAAKFDDILEEDFLDTYHNLTLKSMAMLKWVNLTCIRHKNVTNSPKYILKTDDDIFINFDRLLRVTHDLPNAKMIGRLTCGAVPIGDIHSKLYMPKYLYADRVYPGYLSGTAYVLRTDIIPTLIQNSLTTPLIHLEDIYVTGLLARKSNIYPEDSPFFTYNRIEPKDDCPFRVLVDSHQMKPDEMHVIYDRLRTPPSVPCNLKKAKWLRRIGRLTKRLRNLCLFK